jgi:hypothetical protein
MLPSSDAGVAEGVGVGVGLCANNSPAATTVNANAKQKLIRVLPETPPMYGNGSKMALFGKHKNPVDVVESRIDGCVRDGQADLPPFPALHPIRLQ